MPSTGFALVGYNPKEALAFTLELASRESWSTERSMVSSENSADSFLKTSRPFGTSLLPTPPPDTVLAIQAGS